jgi:hypothetical protein
MFFVSHPMMHLDCQGLDASTKGTIRSARVASQLDAKSSGILRVTVSFLRHSVLFLAICSIRFSSFNHAHMVMGLGSVSQRWLVVLHRHHSPPLTLTCRLGSNIGLSSILWPVLRFRWP